MALSKITEAELPICKIKENLISRAGAFNSQHKLHRLIAIGDVHGAYNGLLLILFQANITLHPERCEWRQQSIPTTLIQTGDMVDRGPRAFDSCHCLRKLQLDAPHHNAKVIRLLGSKLVIFNKY